MASAVAFEMVPTADNAQQLDAASPAAPSVSKSGKVKHGKSISWSSVNFTVKDKVVLKDCWGEVSVDRTGKFRLLFLLKTIMF